MRFMAFLLVFLVFLTTFVLVMAVYWLITQRKRQLYKRLKNYTVNYSELKHQKQNPQSRFSLIKTLRALAEKIGFLIFFGKYRIRIQKELEKADIPLKSEEFLLINLISCGGAAFAAFLITQSYFITGFMMTLGFYIPLFYVTMKKKKRIKNIEEQLYDAIVMISNALKAGGSFLQALEMVSREMPPPISKEFARVLREMNLGMTTQDALLDMNQRVESEDFDLLVTALLIQREIGGNLSEILDNISSTIRDRVRIAGEIKTLTAQGRLSGIIISLLPIGLGIFMYGVNPEYLMVLFTNRIGILMLVGAVLLQLIGIYLISRIVKIEV